MFGRVQRARGKSAALDLALSAAVNGALENSPYFGKVIDKF
jgi:hypothetical protein